MISLPVEVLVGISFGILIGIVPAFAVGAIGFGLAYYEDRRLPHAAVVGAALPAAAANGYLIGVVDAGTVQVPRYAVVALVVVILALYADSQGRALAADAPRSTELTTVRERTLSAAAIDAVDATGQVTISAAGDVRDVDGHPPLAPDVRAALESGSWRLPSDLPLSELQRRLEARLRTEHDLADVSVSIDGRGRASVAAAPSSKELARRIPDGWRAVSIRATLPTGLAPGDEVVVETAGGKADGVVVGAAANDDRSPDEEATSAPGGSDTAVHDATGAIRRAGATDGGRGRLTVAVPTADAGVLLAEDRGRVVVEPRGARHDFEALSLLEGAGTIVRSVFVDESVREALSEADGVRLLGVRRPGSDGDGPSEWAFEPGGATPEAGAEAFVAGERSVLEGIADDPSGLAAEGVTR